MQTRDVHGNGEYFEHIEGEITIWTKKEIFGEVDSAWIRYGQMCVPITTTKFEVMLDKCRYLVNTGLIPCKCGKEISKEELGGSHFAGYYCKQCWDEFKTKNSRKCRLCGRPLYECYC